MELTNMYYGKSPGIIALINSFASTILYSLFISSSISYHMFCMITYSTCAVRQTIFKALEA